MGKQMIVVSLTTIPSRLPNLYKTINSLLDQTLAPDEIIINVPKVYKRFGAAPQIHCDVPNVRINVCSQDYGPASKLLGTLELNEPIDRIIVVDDDRIYDRELIERLTRASELFPSYCITECGMEIEELCVPNKLFSYEKKLLPRGARSIQGFIDTLQGCCGFIIRKQFFNKHVFQIPQQLFLQDDVYLSGYLAKYGVPIFYNGSKRDPARHESDNVDALFDLSGDQNRFELNNGGIEYFRKNFRIWI